MVGASYLHVLWLTMMVPPLKYDFIILTWVRLWLLVWRGLFCSFIPYFIYVKSWQGLPTQSVLLNLRFLYKYILKHQSSFCLSDLVPSGSTLSLNWLFYQNSWLSFNMIPTSHVLFYSRERLNRKVKLKPWTFMSFKFEWCSKIPSTASDCIILKALSTSLQRFCYKCYRQYPPLSPEIIPGLPSTAHFPAHYQLSDRHLPVDDVIKTSSSVSNCHIKTLNWARNLRFLLIYFELASAHL